MVVVAVVVILTYTGGYDARHNVTDRIDDVDTRVFLLVGVLVDVE